MLVNDVRVGSCSATFGLRIRVRGNRRHEYSFFLDEPNVFHQKMQTEVLGCAILDKDVVKFPENGEVDVKRSFSKFFSFLY